MSTLCGLVSAESSAATPCSYGALSMSVHSMLFLHFHFLRPDLTAAFCLQRMVFFLFISCPSSLSRSFFFMRVFHSLGRPFVVGVFCCPSSSRRKTKYFPLCQYASVAPLVFFVPRVLFLAYVLLCATVLNLHVECLFFFQTCLDWVAQSPLPPPHPATPSSA